MFEALQTAESRPSKHLLWQSNRHQKESTRNSDLIHVEPWEGSLLLGQLVLLFVGKMKSSGRLKNRSHPWAHNKHLKTLAICVSSNLWKKISRALKSSLWKCPTEEVLHPSSYWELKFRGMSWRHAQFTFRTDCWCFHQCTFQPKCFSFGTRVLPRADYLNNRFCQLPFCIL